jgi:hypothetical protein
MFALTSPTKGGRSVGIVRFRTKATGLLLFKHREILAGIILRCSALFCLRMHVNDGAVEVLIFLTGNPHDKEWSVLEAALR